MASLAFCNRCFQPPRGTCKFSLTSCGHVYCDACLQKGKKDQCIICNVPCRTILLTSQVDFNIQAFFMDIDCLCKKYSKETSLISEFQEKQRGRLLTFYKEKTSKLEDSLKTLTKQMQQLERMNALHRSAQGSVSKPVTSLFSTPSGVANGYSARSFRPPYSSASNVVDSMKVDSASSPVRKPETPVAPVRISLISPPQGGRMGSVSYRGSGLTASQNRIARASPFQPPSQTPPRSQNGMGMWDASGFRIPQCTPPLSQASVSRPPISIPGLLQRQHLATQRWK
ncbi:probable E3 SUMO-protein ligase RNF212 [Tachyglossus aculeatus]|uniref:probable E3 SUMO-protein ligase RNF212 n=1 Tax=Tachyglossus aculeatus TaxID=9261 RepID=UPI0018F5F445|nr:probable E3 SUMO-protein ligase RNF212 [Tachyglossus aculeatus]